jgi:hypothetical protein
MRVSEDVLAWAKEKSGEYSVRSAYRALVLYDGHEIAQGSDAVSSSMGDEGLWKKLWKINVVPKVRTFWWRVLKGFMPDYATLSRRHIKEESICGICKSTIEDVKHALIECSHAKLFWEAAKEILNLKLPRLHPMHGLRTLSVRALFQRRTDRRSSLLCIRSGTHGINGHMVRRGITRFLLSVLSGILYCALIFHRLSVHYQGGRSVDGRQRELSR